VGRPVPQSTQAVENLKEVVLQNSALIKNDELDGMREVPGVPVDPLRSLAMSIHESIRVAAQ
jgi:hypothetical protein